MYSPPGNVVQSVRFWTADVCLTADPGVAISISAQYHTFAETDYEIVSTAILRPSADSKRVVVSYKWKYVHEVLVNLLVKPCIGKKCCYVNRQCRHDHSC